MHPGLGLAIANRMKEQERKSAHRGAADVRRVNEQYCNYLTDVNAQGKLPFKDNLCCKKLMCCEQYRPQDVLVLRSALVLRPRGSTDRRAFLSARYQPALSSQQRGSGMFLCDTPDACRLFSAIRGEDEQGLPLLPRATQRVCANFFHWAYDVSRTQTGGALSSRILRRKRRRDMDCPKQWEVEQWLVDLSKYYQVQPDSDIILLPFANRASVYDIYKVDEDNDQRVSKSYFLKTWRTSRFTKHIRLRKHLRFTKCDTCVELRERKSRTMDRTKLERVRQEEFEHYQFVKAERGGYYKRRLFTCKYPDRALSLIIDGADWYNYAIPYFATKTHETSKLYRFPVYIMGVISHGRGTKCYLVPGHFKQGTNVVLDIIIRTLIGMKGDGQNIPKIIYLQLDNTCKQNKNKFLLGMCGYLVYIGVTDRIVISFLPKGHTHEDIDQLFSRLVIALMCRDAKSVTELLSIIRQSYRDRNGKHTETEELTSVANLSDWIGQYLNRFDGLTRFRQFVIKKVDGHVVCRVRKDTVDGKWSGIAHHTNLTKIFRTEPPRSVIFCVPPSCSVCGQDHP